MNEWWLSKQFELDWNDSDTVVMKEKKANQNVMVMLSLKK